MSDNYISKYAPKYIILNHWLFHTSDEKIFLPNHFRHKSPKRLCFVEDA